MGYVLRVRLASFFTGAALASAAGLYYLQKDYAIAHHAISQQVSLSAPSAFLFKFIVLIISLITSCSILVGGSPIVIRNIFQREFNNVKIRLD